MSEPTDICEKCGEQRAAHRLAIHPEGVCMVWVCPTPTIFAPDGELARTVLAARIRQEPQ